MKLGRVLDEGQADSSSSRYVSLQGDSANGETLRSSTRRDSGSSDLKVNVRKDSVGSVGSGKGLVQGGKEDKVKSANKKGLSNKIFGRNKDAKTPKEDKAAVKKEKSKALTKKEKTEDKMVKKPKEKDVFDDLQTVFNQSLAYRTKLLQGPVTTESQAQLMKSENMFQWLQSKLQETGVAKEDSGSQTDINAASNGASTAHAEQCAELCAERILAIVEKKLSAKQTDA